MIDVAGGIGAVERDLQPFFRRLAALGPISADDRALWTHASSLSHRFAASAEVIREGAAPETLWVVASGVALGARRLENGLQQHVCLFTTGDPIDLEGFILGRSSITVTALLPLRVVGVPAATASALVRDRPALAAALWRSTAALTQATREWMVGMGRRSAYARLAHFLCELWVRLEQADLVKGDACPFPLTQGDLADVLGLSVVHVNRVLQQLRAEGLIALSHGRLTVLDWPKLCKSGEFDDGYLRAWRIG